MDQLSLLSGTTSGSERRAAQARAQVDRDPLAVREYDPVKAQAEMLADADRLHVAALRRLAGMNRKDDPEAYDAARDDVRDRRNAVRAIKTFGPNA